MAIEIVDFPIKNGGCFHSYVSHYQRVSCLDIFRGCWTAMLDQSRLYLFSEPPLFVNRDLGWSLQASNYTTTPFHAKLSGSFGEGDEVLQRGSSSLIFFWFPSVDRVTGLCHFRLLLVPWYHVGTNFGCPLAVPVVGVWSLARAIVARKVHRGR